MESVSARFLAALSGPHKLITQMTITPPSGTPTVVPLEGGTLKVSADSRVRRTADLEVLGNSSVYEQVMLPGSIVSIRHGLDFGSDTEMVQLITGEIDGDGQQELGDGTISCSIVDFTGWLSRCKFLVPYIAAASARRVDVITAVVQFARPGTVVVNESSDTDVLGSKLSWTTQALDVISDLSADGGLECFFRPDGVFLIRDARSTTTAPVWTANSGDFGVLKKAARRRPANRLYNTVAVRPAATDGSQKWKQQVAQVTDPTHPRHPSKVGVVPYFVELPTAKNAYTAMGVAVRTLDRVLGTTEYLSIESIANPALDANDVIRVITPTVNTDPAQIFQHFVDSFSFDFKSGSMSAATRSQAVDIG